VDSVTLISHNETAKTCVLALKGNFSPDLAAYVYSSHGQVVFAPTQPIKQSFLLLSAQPSRSSAGAATATTGEQTMGVNPFVELPSANTVTTPTYTVALLTASEDDLTGSDAIVLYEPNAPAQVVSISDCVKEFKGAGKTVPGVVVVAPGVWELKGVQPSSATIGSPDANGPQLYSISQPNGSSPTSPGAPVFLQVTTAAQPSAVKSTRKVTSKPTKKTSVRPRTSSKTAAHTKKKKAKA